MKLSQVGELGLLAELERRGLAQAIENDAAQVEGLVVTQDALVEGVHFRLDWISWRDLGWRAAAVNLSDLAASGAEPAGLVVSLAAPGETNLDDVLELYEGIAETGVPVVGGDTTRSEQLMLSVTALGRSERVPGRSGARPGDLLVVTGPLGAAGAAFRNGRYVRPPLRLAGGSPARDRRERDARPLGRPVAGRRPHRRALGRPLRDRPRARPARRGRNRRGPRLRRGLRAARRNPRPARLHGDRALSRKAPESKEFRTPAGSTSARACRGARRSAARAPSRSPPARSTSTSSSRPPHGRRR